MAFTVNGHTYEWGDMQFAKTGTSVEGVVSVSYGHSVDPQDAPGAGYDAADYTRGQYSAKEVTVEVKQAYWDAWRNDLGPGFMRKRHTYTVSYADDDEETTTDTLQVCQVKDVSKNPKRGSDPLTVNVTLKCKKVLENGMDPVRTK